MTAQPIEIAGQKMFILTSQEFERLSQAAENYEDICAAAEAQARREGGEEYVPSEIVDQLLNGENPLMVWRKHRGLSMAQLAEQVGHKAAWINKLEKGRLEGKGSDWQRLAKVLSVDVEDILPPLSDVE